jgi:exonuclease VII small subunit
MQERETAGQVKELFAEEGSEHVVRGLGAALGQSGQGAQMTAQQRQELTQAEAEAKGAQSSVVPFVRQNAENHLKAVRSRIAQATRDENLRMAGEMIGTAPTSAASRRRIGELATAFPRGFPANFAGHLAEMEPEAIAAQEADEGPGSDAFAEKAKKGVEARKAARKRKDAEEKVMDDFLRGEAGESKKGLAALTKKAKLNAEVKGLEEQFAKFGEEYEIADRNPSEAKQRRAHRNAVQSQAEGLARQAPGIVGQAFGPQAAAMAGNANAAEMQAMTREIARNLEQGQMPAEAVLDAFRQVAEASARNARASQQFNGRLNGIVQRHQSGLEQTPMSSGLQR